MHPINSAKYMWFHSMTKNAMKKGNYADAGQLAGKAMEFASTWREYRRLGYTFSKLGRMLGKTPEGDKILANAYEAFNAAHNRASPTSRAYRVLEYSAQSFHPAYLRAQVRKLESIQVRETLEDSEPLDLSGLDTALEKKGEGELSEALSSLLPHSNEGDGMANIFSKVESAKIEHERSRETLSGASHEDGQDSKRDSVLSRYQSKFGLINGTGRYLWQRPFSTMYVVQGGDSLFGIAENRYGNGAEWKRLAEVNILDTETGMINPNDKILLPTPKKPKKRKIKKGFQTYAVVEGDSLFGIAEKTYRNGAEWKRLAELNGLDQETGMINPGDELIVPSPQAPKKPGIRNLLRRDTNYLVLDGDSLYGIAEKFYGDGSRWPELAQANELDMQTGMVNPGDTIFIPKGKKQTKLSSSRISSLGGN